MTTKLQVPMDEKLKKGLEVRAKKLGFDSAQAYIRFWATAEINGRKVYFDEPEQMTPKMEAIIAKAEAEIKNGEVSPTFNSAQEAIDYLKKLR